MARDPRDSTPFPGSSREPTPTPRMGWDKLNETTWVICYRDDGFKVASLPLRDARDEGNAIPYMIYEPSIPKLFTPGESIRVDYHNLATLGAYKVPRWSLKIDVIDSEALERALRRLWSYSYNFLLERRAQTPNHFWTLQPANENWEPINEKEAERFVDANQLIHWALSFEREFEGLTEYNREYSLEAMKPVRKAYGFAKSPLLPPSKGEEAVVVGPKMGQVINPAYFISAELHW